MAQDRPKVRVACTVPNGLALQLLEPFDDGSGLPAMRRVGPRVVIKGSVSPRSDLANGPEITEIDAEFWEKWLAQNKDTALVTEKAVRLHEEPKAEK